MNSQIHFFKLNSKQQTDGPTGLSAKKAWSTPDIEFYGNIAKITQGGPPGSGDSGAGALTENPNFS